ncbi:hypothetical protein MLJ37_001461 [Klebsiella pneumoniae]|jgi:hypothetical protein|nr:hypothetical protein [Klebsiella pneumoniae]
MAFKLLTPRMVQIHYMGGYLCDKEIDIELIYTVESVRQDEGGNIKASLSVRYDDQAKIMLDDYPVTIEPDSQDSWTEQAEAQIMALSDFTGAVKIQ